MKTEFSHCFVGNCKAEGKHFFRVTFTDHAPEHYAACDNHKKEIFCYDMKGDVKKISEAESIAGEIMDS